MRPTPKVSRYTALSARVARRQVLIRVAGEKSASAAWQTTAPSAAFGMHSMTPPKDRPGDDDDETGEDAAHHGFRARLKRRRPSGSASPRPAIRRRRRRRSSPSPCRTAPRWRSVFRRISPRATGRSRWPRSRKEGRPAPSPVKTAARGFPCRDSRWRGGRWRGRSSPCRGNSSRASSGTCVAPYLHSTVATVETTIIAMNCVGHPGRRRLR